MTTVSAAADSSDSMITKRSPDFQQRATPETMAQFSHPATPQSYHSAPSPYHNPDQTSFSPSEPQFFNQRFPQSQDSDQLNWEQLPQYGLDYHKYNRFHPYTMQVRASQVSSLSPQYGQPPNQLSSSPNQCDICGFVFDSAVQLNEHRCSAHAGSSTTTSSASIPFQQLSPKQHSKESDILDLDSLSVVYQGNEREQPNSSYDQSTPDGRKVNSRAVSMMPWETHSHSQLSGNVSLFEDQKIFGTYVSDTEMCNQEQKFPYVQEKILAINHDQKTFMHLRQKNYPGVQMPLLMTDYSGTVAFSNPDLKPPYRPHNSPEMPQITSKNSTNPVSLSVASMGEKEANLMSNKSRRPKAYNCTACNKWFTSLGHLKRHYNTTLHKNSVRSSGQPDPATMLISNNHRSSRKTIQTRTAQPSEDGRVDDASLQLPYASQSFERSHRITSMQPKSPYTYIQQGNLDNNTLADHPLQHQTGCHPFNIARQPSGMADDNNHGSKGVPITTSGNPPNGQAGPSVSQIHHMRGLLSVSTSIIPTPAQTQTTPALTPHTLPPFSHLGVNPYNSKSTDPLGDSVSDHTHTPYLDQNFQQTTAPNYPTENNLPLANPAIGESSPKTAEVVNQDAWTQSASLRLPSFAQLQTQRFGAYVSNYITSPNAEGQVITDESSAGYIIVDPVHDPLQNTNIEIGGQSIDYEYSLAPRPVKEVFSYNPDTVKINPYGYAGEDKREEDFMRTHSSELRKLKTELIMDYANKENYSPQMKSPASPESVNSENESGSPPLISSTVPNTPLPGRNQLKKSAPATVHKCYECDKLFNKACYLTQHNKTFHSGAKPFKCNRCGKRFSDEVSYDCHYMKHTDNKPFKCSECPKSFNYKTDLRRHMCLHADSKPFACYHCGKGFIRKDHMLKHFDTHIKKYLRTSSSPSSSTSPS